MRRYEFQEVTRPARVLVSVTCNGCGADGGPEGEELLEVTIAVNEGEEGGRRDELDYCNDCLVARAPALVAAGSRALIVTGEYLERDED
jgi:hypothetical protein